ncbi:MAG TPA: hypothetical protein DCL60_00835 [Armatimonadetes bacterium]|mgnify:CR=1 FL=1|jgi:cobalt/nickel transport system permease protein|nr:hypothetical protein [Armatimonadota bacterium]
MSHIHLPDGILPAWLWVAGYVISALLVAILWRKGTATAQPREFANLGIFAAVMILAMALEIPPIGFHFNLSVITGIILKPRMSIIAAFIVNLMLAFVGHGGITVVGLNTLVLTIEMVAGCYMFRFLQKRMPMYGAGFAATVIGLACGTAASFGIIAAGSRWIEQISQSTYIHLGKQFTGGHLILGRLAVIMFSIGLIGWILEGILTAAILVFLSKNMPGLISNQEAG